jgi:hypothetical protein
MLVSRCQKAGQRQSIKIGNRSFESVAKFKYLGTPLTDQNCIHEEIKSRLNSGNACMWHTWERREKCTRFWWESPKDWLRTGTGGGLL